jgi:hypothetical protein
MAAERKDVWASGDAYEPYVGRWSRLVAREFVKWIGVASKKQWLDVGCGTGALCGRPLHGENCRRCRAGSCRIGARALLARGGALSTLPSNLNISSALSGARYSYYQSARTARSEINAAALASDSR